MIYVLFYVLKKTVATIFCTYPCHNYFVTTKRSWVIIVIIFLLSCLFTKCVLHPGATNTERENIHKTTRVSEDVPAISLRIFLIVNSAPSSLSLALSSRGTERDRLSLLFFFTCNVCVAIVKRQFRLYYNSNGYTDIIPLLLWNPVFIHYY